MRVWILANNGEAVCDEHLYRYGVDAKGRDHSGRKALLVTPEVAQESIRDFGWEIKCEHCGCKAALVHAPQSKIIA